MCLKNLGQLVACSTFFRNDTFIFRFNLQTPSVLFSVKMTQVSGSLRRWDLLACLKGLFCFTSVQLALCLPAETMCGPAAVSPWRLSAELTNRFQRDNKQPRIGAEARRLRLRQQFQSGVKEPQHEPSRWLQKEKEKSFRLGFLCPLCRTDSVFV